MTPLGQLITEMVEKQNFENKVNTLVNMPEWEFSGAKQACEPIEGYETCCPECDHQFKTDFVY